MAFAYASGSGPIVDQDDIRPGVPMSSLYSEQRRDLIAKLADFAALLPETPPEAPAVPATPPADRRRLLAEAANNHASLLMVHGWGDGSLIEALVDDPLVRQKQVLVLVVAGEEAAFAASFR